MPCHCSRAAWALLALLLVQAAPAAQQPAASSAGSGTSSTFVIFFGGAPIGREEVTVSQSPEGWTIASFGIVSPPIDLTARQVRIRYTPDWKPVDLILDATLGGKAFTGRTTVTGTQAHTVFTQGGKTGEHKQTMADDAVLLPDPLWAPFEAVSQRLQSAAPGSVITAHGLQGSFQIQIGQSRDETFQTSTRVIDARRTTVRLVEGPVSTAAEIWSERNGRLLRVSVPAQGTEVIREDIISVAVRYVPVSRPGDQVVRIPSTGFSLAGTVSKPEGATAALPAVILVSGAGPTDRDEIVWGISIFGQLANALADQGFLVVRYDKRGAGQSGGRPEAAALGDYVEDLRAVVRFLRQRKDVDRDRLALVGYGEGGAIALSAARDGNVAALALINAMGVSGAELNMWQAEHGLDETEALPDHRTGTLELQKKIQAAVLSGKGWDDIPPEIRAQADTVWFKSYLAFKPDAALRDVRKPVLILHALLDSEIPASNAERFEAAAAQTKHPRQVVEVVRVPGVNHLLVPAVTGKIEEYPDLKDTKISPAVLDPLVAWLRKSLAASR
jgi:pimeloyl-ACP methyl ester carboxylesterase